MLTIDTDIERYNKVQKIIGRQKISMIQQIFGSYLASQIICEKCQKQSWTLDLTYHWAIPIAKGQKWQPQTIPKTEIQGIKYYK